jgi:glycosyltransferase involved in cell wall biosynthesis
MRVLSIHNSYQHSGGEDSVFANEAALLQSAGHDVETLLVSNHAIKGYASKASTAALAVYNPFGRHQVTEAIARTRPDVVHVHNFFPLISPALFDACRRADIPAVWTIHNYRVLCANGLMFRNGAPCEDCLARRPLPALLHACYRDSYLGSAAVAAMIAYHSAAGTWQRKVAQFIAPSRFVRSKLIAAGLPENRITVKPNFVTPPGHDPDPAGSRTGAVFIGRLSREKGAHLLVDAWRHLDIPLKIIGDGPERAALEDAASSHISFVGRRSREEVFAALSSAQAVVIPSLSYETFGLVAIEAMALGTPVIAARLGALADIVIDGINGFHFEPGHAADLTRVAAEAFRDSTRLLGIGREARRSFDADYSPERNLKQLLAIYEKALALHARSPKASEPCV